GEAEAVRGDEAAQHVAVEQAARAAQRVTGREWEADTRRWYGSVRRMPTLRRVLRLLAPHRGRVAVSGALALGVGALSAATIGALIPVLNVLFVPDGIARSAAQLGRFGPLARSL